jgi:hypothetical protein
MSELTTAPDEDMATTLNRERFESAAMKVGVREFETGEDGSYTNDWTRHLWIIWPACDVFRRDRAAKRLTQPA